MDLTQNQRPNKMYDVIEPNTMRVLEMRRIKEQKQRENAQLEEQFRKQQESKKQAERERAKRRQLEERNQKLRREAELRRKREQDEQSSKLSGKFGHMINDLNSNSTNLEFTTSGMDLRPAQIKVLIANVQNNCSLKGLTMCRKKLTDSEGKQVSQNLKKNDNLERLQLQGNILTSESLYHLAKLLGNNDCLRLIDLEDNKLLKGEGDEPNYKGINQLCQALKKNQTILSINLNNTGLNSHCSQKLREVMQLNDTLILLDIERNPNMDIDDAIAIQDKLIRNKQAHDDERYMEFIERKRMRREEDISGVLLLNTQTKKLRGEAIDLNIKTKKSQLDEEWNDFLIKEEIKRQKEIQRMEKQSATKKKKKK